MKQQRGFTLIELVMVIVILGILAAVALPKFVDLSSDARRSVMSGVEGAMRSADVIIYAKAAANGVSSTASSSVTINGATVNTAYGYAADATELAKVMTLSPSADFTVAAGSIQHAKATTVANCQIAYTAATGVNTPPVYTATLTGC